MFDTITITLEEYKELLIIKGKYEELKSRPTLAGYRYSDVLRDETPNLRYYSRDIKAYPIDEVGIPEDKGEASEAV